MIAKKWNFIYVKFMVIIMSTIEYSKQIWTDNRCAPRNRNVLNYVGTLNASIYRLLGKSSAHKTLTSTQENTGRSLSSVRRQFFPPLLGAVSTLVRPEGAVNAIVTPISPRRVALPPSPIRDLIVFNDFIAYLSITDKLNLVIS